MIKGFKEINKNMIRRINELRDYAFNTTNMTERAKRLARVDGYHDAYLDMVHELGLEKEFFTDSVINIKAV